MFERENRSPNLEDTPSGEGSSERRWGGNGGRDLEVGRGERRTSSFC